MLSITRRPNRPLIANRVLDPTRLFDDVFFNWPFGTESGGTITSEWMPAVDIFEDNDNLKINVEVPGVRPEDVKISLEGNTLTIRGEKQQVAEEKTERVHRYERTYGTFERSFTLPNSVDPDRIEARSELGVLTILVPKAERARPREISVKAGK